MKKIILFCLFACTLFSTLLRAQCPPPNFPNPGFTCTTAPILCPDLNGYCANTAFAPTLNPAPQIPGCSSNYSLNNPIWFAFFAGTSTITMNITAQNCVGGGSGIQAGIYQNCISGVMDVQCTSSNNFVLTNSNFVPGQIYYIFIDGFSGADCDVHINVTQGSTVQQTPATPGLITGLDTVCVNSSSNYSVTPVQFASTYSWTLTPALGTQSGTNNSTTVNFGSTPGTTSLCVRASNQCLANTNPSCKNVTIIPLPTATLSGTAFICQNNPQPANLQVAFTGASPWRFVYSIGGVPQPPITTTQNPYTLTVNTPGTVSLVSVVSAITGASCPGTVSGSVAVNQIVVNPSSVVTPSTCGGLNGAIDLSVTGGTSPYTFNWSNGATTEDLTGIAGGQSYMVTVTSLNGCTGTRTIAVPNNQVTISAPGVVVSNTNCNGIGTGSIDITPSPANPAYVYNWSNGASTEDISNLLPGSYTVTVSQGTSCSQTATFTVLDAPNLPVLAATPTGSICGLGNGSIDLTASGGVAPFTFLWSNTAITEDLTMIPAGSYSVTATGANGCTKVLAVTVPNTNPAITISGTPVTNTTCPPNASNGSISISINPATPPTGSTYQIDWSTGAMNVTSLTNLAAGAYTVTVNGGGACTSTASFTIPSTPNNPTASATTTPTTCSASNGNVDLSPSGGVSPYTFLWSNSATTEDLANVAPGSYTVTVTGANGCTTTTNVAVSNTNPPISVTPTLVPNTACTPGSENGSIVITINPTTPPGAATYQIDWSTGAMNVTTINNLPSGTYTVTVNGGGACTTTASFTIQNTPNLPTASATATTANCAQSNGSINLTPSGGVAPYTFLWSNSATTEDLANVAPGTYTVTVTAANGCTTTTSATVGNTNPPISIAPVITPNSGCNPASQNGNITITINPATPPGAATYQIDWSTGAMNVTTINNLPTGTYTVTVNGGGACTTTASFTVPNNPVAPQPTAVATNASCSLTNGAVDLSVTGGLSPFTYLWSNSATTEDLANVAPGTYTVTVTGANGCTQTTTTTVGNDNLGILVTGTPTPNTLCLPAQGNGTISISIAPATPPAAPTYQITWSNGAASTTTLNNLPTGSYTVTVNGGGSCTTTATFVIAHDPNNPNLTLSPSEAACGLSNGLVDGNVTGGLPPYTYLWSNGQTTQDLLNYPPGTYSLTVTGANGCTDVETSTIDVLSPTIDITPTIMPSTICTQGLGNGSISISIVPSPSPSGNPYAITWSNGATTTANNNLNSGTYTVTVSSGGTCTSSATFTVPLQPNTPNLSLNPTQAFCGQPNGNIYTTASLGQPPYSYQWSNGATSSILNNVTPGTYSLTLTDATSCTVVKSVVLANENPVIEIYETNQPNTACQGASNGSLSLEIEPVTPPGGQAAYAITWSNGATGFVNNNLPAGVYTVTVSSGGSCTAQGFYIVEDEINLPTVTSSITPSVCGNANGSVTLTPANGTPPYTYSWNTGATTQNLNPIAGGNYTVTVTDAKNCSKTLQVTVPNNTVTLALNASVTAKTSCAVNNGAIDLTVTPTGAYFYKWSNNSITEDLASIAAGTYTVTVSTGSAGSGCTATATYTVANQAVIPTADYTLTPAVCGESNGSINVSVLTGTAPITYVWSNGATTEDLSNLTAGNYNLTITGQVACTAALQVTVPNDAVSFTATPTITNNTSCAAANGGISLQLSPTQAALPTGLSYTYLWSSGQTTQNISNMSASSYTVTVSTGTSGCTQSYSYTVANNAVPPTANAAATAATCGQMNGAVNLTASGGTAPLTYLWSNAATIEDLVNLAPGTFSVTVTDASQCTTTATATVNNNNFAITIAGTVANNTACNTPNGGVQIALTPATPPNGTYTYAWSNGATSQNISNVATGVYTITVSGGGTCTASSSFQVQNQTSNPVITQVVSPTICGNSNGGIDLTVTPASAGPFTFIWSNSATTEDLTGLATGNFSVTVTDATGCVSSKTINVPNNSSGFSIAGVESPVTRCDAPNGAVDLTVTPTTGSYVYAWSNGSSTQDLTGLLPGTYTVTVNESGPVSCPAEASFTILDQRDTLLLSQNINPSQCGLANGSIDLTVLGGTTPYTYLWSNAATTQDLQNIVSATYSVTVTDPNGCKANSTDFVDDNSIDFTIAGSTSPNTSCGTNTGAITVTISPPGTYTYLWSNGKTTKDLTATAGGAYALTVSAGGNCTAVQNFTIPTTTLDPQLSNVNQADVCGQSLGAINLSVAGGQAPFTYLWSNGATTEDLNNVAAGAYNVTVTGANACSTSAAINLGNNSVNISITETLTPNTSCASTNGAIGLIITPAGTYTQVWSTGQTTQNLTGLASGDYMVTVSLGTTCTASENYVILESTGAPVLTSIVTDDVCNANMGGIDLTATGASPFTFAWSNGKTTEDLTGIKAGAFTVTVTDANGCKSNQAFTVLNNSNTFSFTGQSTQNTLCSGGNGAIDLTVVPASPTYGFVWSNGATTEDVTGLLAGTYSVTVSEAGCTAESSFTVTNNTNAPQIAQAVQPSVCGLPTGAIDLTLSGGQSPYTYLWSNGKTTEDLTLLSNASFMVTVTDANGCTAARTIVVPATTVAISIAEVVMPNSRCGSVGNGAIDLSITPTGSYSVLWSSGQTTEDISNLPTGNYTVTVSTGTSCTAAKIITVAENIVLPTITGQVVADVCNGGIGSISLTTTGAAPLGYLWSNAATSKDLTALTAGNYTVTLTDAKGCTSTKTFTVGNNSNTFSFDGSTSPNTLCGGVNGSVSLIVTPAGTNYSFLWSNAATTKDLSDVAPGDYSVTISDGGGCTAEATYTVGNNAPTPVVTGVKTDVLCFGEMTGAIQLTTTGGQTPYTHTWSPVVTDPTSPSNLTAGTYNLTVNDAAGCSTTATFAIQQPTAALTLSCQMTQGASMAGANDGAARVNITGGTALYKVDWTPGGDQSGVAAGNFAINNLTDGTYTVTVTDAHNCTAVCGFTIAASACLSAVGTMALTPLSACGTACITAIYDPSTANLDADDALQFILHTGTTSQIVGEIARNNQATFCFDAGLMSYGTTYYISAVVGNANTSGVVDLNDMCTVVSAGTPISFSETPTASITTPDNLNCQNRQIQLQGASNLAGATFAWQTTNGQIVGASNQVTATVSKAGAYTFIATVNGCADTTSTSVQDLSSIIGVFINADPAGQLDCVIETVTLTSSVTGSTTVTYEWMNDGNTLGTTSQLLVEASGIFDLIVTDTVTFCSDTATIEIVDGQQYPPLNINTPALLSCKDSLSTLIGSSPVSGLDYLWIFVENTDTTSIGTTATVQVSVPGQYWFVGVDPVNGCTNEIPVTVNANLSKPTADAGTAFTLDCLNPIEFLDGSGSQGTGALQYKWSTLDGKIESGQNSAAPGISLGGVYILIVTDGSNGCTSSDAVVVETTGPSFLPQIVEPRCYGDKGSFDLSQVTGGTPPYRYSIDGGNTLTAKKTYTNVTAGLYTLLVQDNLGCTDFVDISLIEPPLLSLILEPLALISLGDTYQIQAQASLQADQLASIIWTPSDYLTCANCLNPIASPPRSTLYELTVEDSLGCKASDRINIEVERATVYAPTVFNPNDPTDNYVFTLFADLKNVKSIQSLQIFDRWGTLVFQNSEFLPNDLTKGWDGSYNGKPLNPAVFVWYAKVEYVNGLVELIKGGVTLIR